jgi:hypothetical protein
MEQVLLCCPTRKSCEAQRVVGLPSWFRRTRQLLPRCLASQHKGHTIMFHLPLFLSLLDALSLHAGWSAALQYACVGHVQDNTTRHAMHYESSRLLRSNSTYAFNHDVSTESLLLYSHAGWSTELEYWHRLRGLELLADRILIDSSEIITNEYCCISSSHAFLCTGSVSESPSLEVCL